METMTVGVIEEKLSEREFPKRRGRPKKTIDPVKWVCAQRVPEMMDLPRETVIALVKDNFLAAAVYRGGLYISIESIEGYNKRSKPDIGSNPFKTIDLLPLAVREVVVGGRMYSLPPQEETIRHPQPVEWSDRNNKARSRFDRQPVVRYPFVRKTIDQIKGFEYELQRIAYEVNDLWYVFGVHPDTLFSWAGCGKVFGFWEGRNFFIDYDSLQRFFKRVGR